MLASFVFLTVPILVPDDERKLAWIFIFTLRYGASKGIHKIFCNTTKKWEKKKISYFLFEYNFLKCTAQGKSEDQIEHVNLKSDVL